MNMDTIKEIDVKSVMTKSSLPVGGYSVNPYVGCPHACRYCYASFMKRKGGKTKCEKTEDNGKGLFTLYIKEL